MDCQLLRQMFITENQQLFDGIIDVTLFERVKRLNYRVINVRVIKVTIPISLEHLNYLEGFGSN